MQMPGQMPMPMSGEWGTGPENTSADSMIQNPPVIPHPDLYTIDGEDEDEEEAVSSGMDSMESLTTPPAKQRSLPGRAASVRSAGGSALSHRTEGGGGGVDGSVVGGGSHRPSASGGGGSRAGSAIGAGSAVGTISDSRWDEVLRSASRPPIGFPMGPFTPSGVVPAETPSNKGKGRTLSMSTNRSGQ